MYVLILLLALFYIVNSCLQTVVALRLLGVFTLDKL